MEKLGQNSCNIQSEYDNNKQTKWRWSKMFYRWLGVKWSERPCQRRLMRDTNNCLRDWPSPNLFVGLVMAIFLFKLNKWNNNNNNLVDGQNGGIWIEIGQPQSIGSNGRLNCWWNVMKKRFVITKPTYMKWCIAFLDHARHLNSWIDHHVA